jgi:uncharacterized membrane protein
MERSAPDTLGSLDSLEGVPPSREGQFTRLIARVLRVGVNVAGFFVALGLVVLLLLHQGGRAGYFTEFHPRPQAIRHGLLGVFTRDLHRHAPRDLINLGLMLLILTPLVRVAFSVVVYLYENDRLYTAFTLFVLAVLLYSLLGG